MEGTFRKTKRKANIRTSVKSIDDDDSNDEETILRIHDIQEVQKVRQKPKGLDVIECAVGKELAKEFRKQDDDPMRSGGLLRLNDTRKAALNAADIENDIKEQFKKETLLRDEHEEMRKYIEERLSAKTKKEKEEQTKKMKFTTIEDEILYRADEKIKKYSRKANDELLSNQMLVGIPEVDLGIEIRMRNIVETEQKKMELIKR